MAVNMISKNEYMKRTRIKTDEWISRLSRLDTEARDAGEAVRIKCELRIADFRGALEGFQEKITKIEEADNREWEEQRDDAENDFSALEESFGSVSRDINKIIQGISSVGGSDIPRDADEWDH